MANFHVDSSGNMWLGENTDDDFSTAIAQTDPSDATLPRVKFYVTNQGFLKAIDGEIGGIVIDADGIESSNYNASTGTGWRINNDYIYLVDGNQVGGISVTNNSIQSTNFSGSNGFQINADGSAIFRSITISGYATTSQVNNVQSTADSASTAASNAQSTANNADSAASSAQSTANTAQSTANTANTIANTTSGTLGTLQTNLFYSGTTEINGGTIRTGTLSADKITTGQLSAARISAGTLSGFTISGGSVTGASVNAIGLDVTSTASNAIDCAGGVDAEGVVSGSTFQHSQTSSQIGFATSYVYLRGGGTTDFAAGSENISYNHLRPSTNNIYDLGTSSYRWDDVYATNGTINTSDITLKENIVTTDLGLDFINDLTPIEFTWKAYGGGTVSQGPDLDDITIETPPAGTRTHLGFSAQDIKEKLITHKGSNQNMAVYTESQYSEDFDSETMTNEFGLRHNQLIPILTKAVQQLSTQVSDLTARIETLEG